MENDYSREICKEDRLPMFHRTIKLPTELWDKAKERGNREKKALRWIVDEALDAELLPLIESLRQLGLKGEVKADKLVRVPLDDNVIRPLVYFSPGNLVIYLLHQLRILLIPFWVMSFQHIQGKMRSWQVVGKE